MGSVSQESTNIFAPPKLTQNTDRLQWRESVGEEIQTVAECAEGGDTTEKGIPATLTMMLYQSLGAGAKEKVMGLVRYRGKSFKNHEKSTMELQEKVI